MKQKLSCLTLSIALLASSNWCNAANRYVSAGSDGAGYLGLPQKVPSNRP